MMIWCPAGCRVNISATCCVCVRESPYRIPVTLPSARNTQQSPFCTRQNGYVPRFCWVFWIWHSTSILFAECSTSSARRSRRHMVNVRFPVVSLAFFFPFIFDEPLLWLICLCSPPQLDPFHSKVSLHATATTYVLLKIVMGPWQIVFVAWHVPAR